jgi:hypothetical protein
MIKPHLTIRSKRVFRVQWRDWTLRLDYHYRYSSQRFWDGTRLRACVTEDAVFVTVLRGPHTTLPISTSRCAPIRMPTKAMRAAGGPVAVISAQLDAAAIAKPWTRHDVAARQLSLF